MLTKHVFLGKCFGKIGFWTFFLSIFDFPKKLSREKTRYFLFFKSPKYNIYLATKWAARLTINDYDINNSQ